ncbi:MAG TPA: metallophosphoesterase [Vicinamibacterales bacterium]|nr:metallophosphoesterase [Vicinamibacterales bacterium]
MRAVVAAVALVAVGGVLFHPSAQSGAPDEVAVRPIAAPAHLLPPEDETASVKKFSFFVYGDTRSPGPSRSGEPAPDGREIQGPHAAVVDAMIFKAAALRRTDFPVRFVVSTGDAVLYGPNGTMWNVSYVPVIERLTRQAGLSFFYAPGNHDTTTHPQGDPERSHGLRNLLQAMSNLMPPDGSPRRLSGYATYSFGYGNAFFLLIDSNIATDATQLAWVTNQLERLDRSRYRNVFAVFHHPPFDSGAHGGPIVEPESAAVRAVYLPLFHKHHVRMTLCGHDHLLDHFVERYEDRGRTYRMDHLVSGGGGAPTYTYHGEPDLQMYLQENAGQHVRIEHLAKPGPSIEDNPHHFVIVRVDGTKLSLEVVATSASPFRPYGRERIDLN